MGSAEPYFRRSAAAVVGISCRLAVFMTVRVIIFREAISGVGLRSSFSISRIAAMPKGVEAFPRPSIFAVILRVMYCIAFPPLSSPPNSFDSRGAVSFASFPVSPELCATRISPLHSAIIPTRYMASSTAPPHSSDNTETIARKMISDLAERASAAGVELEVTDAAVRKLARLGYSEKYWARNLYRTVVKKVEDPLADALLRDPTIGKITFDEDDVI